MGNARHLDTNHLWTHEVAFEQRPKFEQALGIANPAGMMTKELAQPDIERHTEFIGASFADGRAEAASHFATDEVDPALATSEGRGNDQFLRERAKAVDRPGKHHWLPRGQSLLNLWVGVAKETEVAKTKFIISLCENGARDWR